MRLWSFDFIPYLPNAQLKALRYEIGDMVKQYPNIKHGLVKYINNYDIKYLIGYFYKVLDEFDKRGINHKTSYDNDIIGTILAKSHDPSIKSALSYPEHNDRYIRQQYYNLQEKADRNLITKEEWKKIYENIRVPWC